MRSYDLIWSKIINDYMEGKRRGMVDLMPWNGDVTFVLTAGRHNARIFSEPGHLHRSYHIKELKVDDPYMSAEN